MKAAMLGAARMDIRARIKYTSNTETVVTTKPRLALNSSSCACPRLPPTLPIRNCNFFPLLDHIAAPDTHHQNPAFRPSLLKHRVRLFSNSSIIIYKPRLVAHRASVDAHVDHTVRGSKEREIVVRLWPVIAMYFSEVV